MARTPQKDAGTDAPTPAETPEQASGSSKGHATPSRREQEAARKQPLVPTDRKLAARQSRTQGTTERERARIGLANGEEKYLPVRDKGPQKRWVRDYVDARTSLGEALLPIMVLVILSYFVTAIAPYVLIGVYVVIVVIVIEGVVVGQLVTRRLQARFGSVERGVRWYTFMRMIQFRTLRMPKPQVKRGQYPSATR